MSKGYSHVLWYRLRYEAPVWLFPALTITALLVASRAQQVYQYSLTAPVCRKVTDAPAGMQTQVLGPLDESQWRRISRCREGWTNVGTHGAHADAERRQNGS